MPKNNVEKEGSRTNPLIAGFRTGWAVATAPAKLGRALGHAMGGLMLATRDSLPCPGCGEEASLVGRWECGDCSYVRDGFAFAACEVCSAVAPFVPCQNCGVGIKNPAQA